MFKILQTKDHVNNLAAILEKFLFKDCPGQWILTFIHLIMAVRQSVKDSMLNNLTFYLVLCCNLVDDWGPLFPLPLPFDSAYQQTETAEIDR